MGRPINKRYLGPQVGGSYTITGYANFGDSGGTEECYVSRQRSVNSFEVVNAADTDEKMIAFLTDSADPDEGEFYVHVDKQNGDDIEHARKITNRRVYTVEGGSYDLVVGAVASADADTANVEGLGGMGVSDVAADPSTTTITADPTSTTSNASTITVQAKDSAGNNLTEGGDTVTVSVDGDATLDGSITDNGDGTYYQVITNDTNETVTVSGTINGEAITDTADITFTT